MDLVLAHWSLSLAVLVCYVAAAAVHLSGFASALRRAGRADAARLNGSAGTALSRPVLIRDAAEVQGGLLAALLVLVSPIGYWSGIYLWVRGIQDLTLCFIAPALIVAGRPWLVVPRLMPGRRDLAAGGTSATAKGVRFTASEDLPELETAWSGAGPVLAVVAFNLAWIGWHLPAAFDLTPGNTAARLAEYACYLGAGVWFWLQVAGPRRPGRWQTPLRRLALLIATLSVGTVLGMVLVFGSSVIYPGYANTAHHVMTVLDDQQLSGAVLWMGMMPSLVIAGIALLTAWLKDEESDTSADLGGLVKRRTSGWPVRPGIR
jgi:cytochrome c oxidase assembly factor CtaG